jgi:hypothetical protein
MKFYLLLFSICVASLNCQQKNDNAKKKFTGWTSHNVNGKVKEITIKSYKTDSLHNTKTLEGLYHNFQFTTTGDELEYNIYDKNNDLKFKSVPTYKNGKISGSIVNHIEEKISETWVIKKYLLGFYGGEIECYIDKKLVKKAVNTVNEKGHQKRLKLFSNGKLIFEKSFDYDKNENMTGSTENSYANDTVYSIKYSFIYNEFDKNKNWTKRTDVVNGKYLTTERVLDYY